MFLKSLTLKGFKSFADTTTLDLEPGVTVVVGPNGSGKSNVVDAVAWVLGAQGPRTVRSAKMEDVIFAGTAKRPALGRAEVSLTIDNSAGLLPIEFSEVTITRTLFRTGESEYAINRVPCRLLDIQELLSDTGVGRQQHVIVSQGNLDTILNSRPEDRRLVIEEAAGVLKYRRRKERSERRLESTEASLVRLQDLVREVRRQLRPLEKQAEAARRHDDLVAELHAVRRHLAGQELAAVESRIAAAARSRRELGEAEGSAREALSHLDAEILAGEAQLAAVRAPVGPDLAELVSRAEGLAARASGVVALLGERRRSVERQLAASVDHDVIASLEAEAAALRQRLDAVDEEAAALLPLADELEQAEADLHREEADVEARWEGGAAPEGDPAAEVRGELGGLRTAVERAVGEIRRLEARIATAEQRVARLDADAARWRATASDAAAAGPGLEAAAEAAEQRAIEADAERDGAEDAERRAEGERHRWAAREEALTQALDEARARAGAARLADVTGVVGTLLELVDVEEGWEAAFEAAAGEVLAAVIVDGVDAARRGLGELHRVAAAGAVAALPDIGARPPATRCAVPPGTAPLAERVRAWLPAVRAFLEQLLASAVVVDGGWEDALDIAVAHPELVVVTRQGDRCANGVWRAGAGGAGVTGAALEEARQARAAAEARAEEAARRRAGARAAAEDARRRAGEARRSLDANESRRRAAADAARRAEEEGLEATHDLEGARAQRAELDARLVAERRRVEELAALLPELEAAAAAQAEQVLAERAARARLAERTAAVTAKRRDLEVRAAGLEERRTLTTRRLGEVEERLRRNAAERDQAAERRVELQRVLTVTERVSELVQARGAEVAAALERLRRARRAETEAARERTDRLEQLRRQRAAAERHLGELRERAGRAELDATEARVRLEALTESIRRDLDCEPEATRGAPCPELPPGTSATSRRAELERELRLLGPVNPLALEEHRALEERHQFLETQLEDVRNARRELTKVIRAVDAEIAEVFRAAYADVAENFEKLFATLFPGGQGRLRLTDPDRPLETGIEIEARPLGKNVRRLSLLSGGERSLVAMAFLFAVFRSRPSPFYLMDEVEAALDDINLRRFLDLVHEFRGEAQLVIVSHQRRTMEAADCLYGVSMPPGGSSRVVSERARAAAS